MVTLLQHLFRWHCSLAWIKEMREELLLVPLHQLRIQYCQSVGVAEYLDLNISLTRSHANVGSDPDTYYKSFSLRTFCHHKVLIKNRSHFLKTFTSTLKSSFNTFGKFSEHITHWKIFQILIHKTLKIGKSTLFYEFSKIFEFYLPLNRLVLTKIFRMDPKLTFNVFHILNHDHISKIEKIFDSGLSA